jgi:release factor glutamine methyltransferase
MNTTNKNDSNITSGSRAYWTPEESPAPNPGQADKTALTVDKAIRRTIKHLQSTGIGEPELAAQILAASRLNCPRLELFTRLNDKLTATQFAAIEEGCRRIAAHEPIQYVIGYTDFMGHSFKCDSRCLIPRPETEELVELIIGHEPLWQIEAPAVIDIGTGNGCIIISLALSRKCGNFMATDVSSDALALAEENARVNNVSHLIKFACADLAGADIPPGMDAVVSNPPYVRTAEFDKLDKNIRLWEPRLALDGGDDGLQVIGRIIRKAYEILKPDRFLFMEIGFDQWPAVQNMLAETGFHRSTVRLDCSGHNRLVMAVK